MLKSHFFNHILILLLVLSSTQALIQSDQINIKFDFSQKPSLPEDQNMLRHQDPHFKHLFKEVTSNHLVLDQETGSYTQIHCTNFIDVSDTLLASEVPKGWGTPQVSSQTYSMIDDHSIDSMIEDVDGLPGMPAAPGRESEHLRFKNVS